jgi:hypothetical protein
MKYAAGSAIRRLGFVFAAAAALGCSSSSKLLPDGATVAGADGAVDGQTADAGGTDVALEASLADAPTIAVDGAGLDVGPRDAGISCSEGLPAPATLVSSTCGTVAGGGTDQMIPDGTYQLVEVKQGGAGCIPGNMPAPASGVLRVTGSAAAGVDGSMGAGGVAFSSWKGNLVYNAGMVQIAFSCGSSQRYGDEISLDPAQGTVAFYRRNPPMVVAWVYKRQ